jgi:isoamylase
MAEGALLSIEPVLGYPRTARPGQRYVLTVDLRSPSGDGEWPYSDAEEVAFYCLVNPGPLFQSEPLGEPAVVLHRFGGTYGPARFLLTAAGKPQRGTVQVTLVNGWGMPLLVLETDEIEIGGATATASLGDAVEVATAPDPGLSHPRETPFVPQSPDFLRDAQVAWPGRPFPLGATWDGAGVNFSLYSEPAWEVELCIYDGPDDAVPSRTYRLRERTGFVWHGYVPGLEPGTLYGFRVNGPYEPGRGYRCNPFKLLVDPYARSLAGVVRWDAYPFAFVLDQPSEDLVLDDKTDDRGVPKGVVIDPVFDWMDDRPPSIAWHDTVIYEAHVKGLTRLHPAIPEELRGTYAAVAHPAIVDHLKSIGVTALELLPVHEMVDEQHLLERGLVNYWGYNTLNFFAPAARYAYARDPGEQVREFKEMVRRLHKAGIEVILDVVYNHTAEGNHLGPTLSFRGLDNSTYYRLVEDNPRYYLDYTGTGNSLNTSHPQTLQLVVDSLRYWVQEMHVDGFRFNMASSLAREFGNVDRRSRLFSVIQSDPVLSRVKLIAEPWDIGPGGYQLGNFPTFWAEWNGKYRDTVRAYWRGDPGALQDLGYRLTGSSDLYQDDGRSPQASINYVTVHDGFTLNDLVSYNHKHNEANGENNRDGDDHNLSYNFGVEGPTDDPKIVREREKQKRNLIATLFLSLGVPMINGGDELGRTQMGNNNAYCQDHEISWHHWDLSSIQRDLLEFTRTMARLRREHPTFRRRKFFRGRLIRGSELKDIAWIRPDGHEMTDRDWESGTVRSFGILLGGDALDEWDMEGERVTDDTFLLLFNAGYVPVEFTPPSAGAANGWTLVVDTAAAEQSTSDGVVRLNEAIFLEGRSLAVFRAVSNEGDSRSP